MRNKDPLIYLKYNILVSISYLEAILRLENIDLESISGMFENFTINLSNTIQKKVSLFKSFLKRCEDSNDIAVLSLFSSKEKDNLLKIIKVISNDFKSLSTQRESTDEYLSKFKFTDFKFSRYHDNEVSNDTTKTLDKLFKLNFAESSFDNQEQFNSMICNQYRYLASLNDITDYLIKTILKAVEEKASEIIADKSTIDLFTIFGSKNHQKQNIDLEQDSLLKFLDKARLDYFKKNIELASNKIFRHCDRSLVVNDKNLKIISAKKIDSDLKKLLVQEK